MKNDYCLYGLMGITLLGLGLTKNSITNIVNKQKD